MQVYTVICLCDLLWSAVFRQTVSWRSDFVLQASHTRNFDASFSREHLVPLSRTSVLSLSWN